MAGTVSAVTCQLVCTHSSCLSFPFHFPLKVVSAEAPDGLNCPLSLPLAGASSFFLCLDNGKVLQSFGMPCLSPQGNRGGYYFFFFLTL